MVCLSLLLSGVYRLSEDKICLVVRKHVFGGGGGRKACFKSVSSAIETSWKIEISPVAGLYMILSKN